MTSIYPRGSCSPLHGTGSIVRLNASYPDPKTGDTSLITAMLCCPLKWERLSLKRPKLYETILEQCSPAGCGMTQALFHLFLALRPINDLAGLPIVTPISAFYLATCYINSGFLQYTTRLQTMELGEVAHIDVEAVHRRFLPEQIFPFTLIGNGVKISLQLGNDACVICPLFSLCLTCFTK